MKKLNMLFIVLLICVNVNVSAEYEYTGFNDFLFEQTSFNNLLTTVTSETVTLSKPVKIPLLVDLDGDGIEEIIIYDNGDIKLYQNKTLDPLIALSSGCDVNNEDLFKHTSNIVASDIDGDGYKELVFSCDTAGTRRIQVFHWNDSTLSKTTLNIGGGIYVYPTLGCDNNNNCILVGVSDGSTNPTYVYAQMFNGSTISALTQLGAYGSANLPCPPRIRAPSIADYDLDGTQEMAVSFSFTYSGSETARILILRADVLTFLPVVELSISDIIYRTGSTCDDPVKLAEISSPVFGNFLSNSGLEIGYAHVVDSNEFKVTIFDNLGNEKKSYPKLFQVDGTILSNAFTGNIIADTSIFDDLCVFGYDSSDAHIRLLCGNEESDYLTHAECDYDTSGKFAINTTTYKEDIITHTIQASTQLEEGNNVQEITNAYGIFRFKSDKLSLNCLTLQQCCEIELLYANPKNESSILMMFDAENVSLSDMVVMTDTNLYYYDDGFVNSKGAITSYILNPCLDQAWKLNTSVRITVTVIDANGDNVCAKVQLYEGTGNQKNSSELCGASGTEFPFSFIANETITTGKIKLFGKDIENNDTWHTIETFFSVQSKGLEYNDCIETVTVGDVDSIPDGTGESCTSTANCNPGLICDTNLGQCIDVSNDPVSGNVIEDAIKETANTIGIGTSILWLIFMGFLAVGIWFGRDATNYHTDDRSALIVIAVIEFILFIIGAMMGFLSTGLVWVFVIMALLTISLIIGKKFFHSQDGG